MLFEKSDRRELSFSDNLVDFLGFYSSAHQEW
jgi:hypothetical protein